MYPHSNITSFLNDDDKMLNDLYFYITCHSNRRGDIEIPCSKIKSLRNVNTADILAVNVSTLEYEIISDDI